MPSTELAARAAESWRQLPGQARRIRVGLSGGLDSTVLLHLLASLRQTLPIELAAAHVQHGLVAGSAAWADDCRRLCDGLAVPLVVCPVQVDRRHPGGLEAAAREARRAALVALGDEVLALAHHRDDQAETVLFRAIRGAGVRGAGGMRPVAVAGTGPLVWRPLLDVPRSALLAYARAHGLAWVDDPSNADSGFSRNFLRNEVLPLVESRFPGAAAGLARMGRLCGEAAGMLDELAALDLAALRLPGSLRLGREATLRLSSARLRNLLRFMLLEAGEAMPDEDRLREIERQLCSPGAVEGLYLPVGGSAVCAYREAWWLAAARHERAPASLAWHLEPAVPWAGGVVGWRETMGEGLAAAVLAGGVCDLRCRAGGERMRLRAGGPSRSLKNLLQEAGVPPWLRSDLPLLWVDGRLAWVAGVGVAAEFRCRPGESGVAPEWSALAA
ncbi:MAG: tRNA lysidine(34) synthetase TilS [Zoogloea sp.]|nr:tRNA lysidine(34) synthetase TilS [Zoogloea sp.]